MKQFKERIGAFRQSPNVRALKMWHSLCPQFFPLKAAEALFGNLSPYFSLWFSAEIINELLDGRDRNRLIALMLITVTGNLAISVVTHILNRAAGHANYLLNQRESAAFMRKTLTLDYQDLESPDVRQLRRKITENGKINGYGKDLLINMICWAMDETVNLVLSLLLSIEMLVKIFTAGFSVRALGFVPFFWRLSSCTHASWPSFPKRRADLPTISAKPCWMKTASKEASTSTTWARTSASTGRTPSY